MRGKRCPFLCLVDRSIRKQKLYDRGQSTVDDRWRYLCKEINFFLIYKTFVSDVSWLCLDPMRFIWCFGDSVTRRNKSRFKGNHWRYNVTGGPYEKLSVDWLDKKGKMSLCESGLLKLSNVVSWALSYITLPRQFCSATTQLRPVYFNMVSCARTECTR